MFVAIIPTNIAHPMRLHLLHRGVYAVGHRPPSPLATAMAAVLACGPDAALSHQSAGALWRILPRWPTPIHVTAPRDRRHPGIHVHRSPHADTTTHYGIRVTTPARTLVDLADVLTPNQLTRALNEAQVQRLVTANRADHPPHPISGPPHLTAHARAGRHPLRARRPTSPASSSATTPAPRAQPTDRRPRSRRRLPTHRSSSSNSTAANSTPPHAPSNTTATATPTSSTRGSPPSASPTTASSTTPPKRRTAPRHPATAASRRSRPPRCAPRPAPSRRAPAAAPTPRRGARASRASASDAVDRGEQLLRRVAVGVEPHAEARLLDALGVVVLVPEQRQDDHRLAEVQALGDRVVAAVGDDGVDLREDRGLGQELLAGHRRRAGAAARAAGPWRRSRGRAPSASVSTSRCISSTSAEPSEPSER